MHRIFPLLLLAGIALAAEPASELPEAYRLKAAELAPVDAGRATGIVALHAFVRDQIAEVPTRWV